MKRLKEILNFIVQIGPKVAFNVKCGTSLETPMLFIQEELLGKNAVLCYVNMGQMKAFVQVLFV